MFLAQNYLNRGFWGDEAWTSLISQLPYKQMLKTTAADFHPPAYYSIVEMVYKFLPPTEIVTRSISIFFYFTTLFLVYKLASEIKGRLFGWICTIVVALNPIFFTYAFEARNYTMFAFAAVGSIYCLVKLSALRQSQDESLAKTFNRRSLVYSIGFIFFSTLGIYTHYYMFFTLAAQGLYLLLFSTKGGPVFGWDRKFLLQMIGLYFVVALLYLPWIPFLYGQLTSVGQSYWIGAIDIRTHYEALLRILGGENENVYRTILFGISVALLLAGIIRHILRHKFEKPYLLIWLWAIIPFILATMPGFKMGEIKLPFRPIFFWRYLINASIPLALVMVHTAQRFNKYLYIGIVVAVIFFSSAIDLLTIARYPYTFRQAYQEKVLGEIRASDSIVTVLPSFAEVLYYRNRLGLTNNLVVLPEGLVQFSGKSLLDAYAVNGAVMVGNAPIGRYFELRPGQSVEVRD